MTVSDLSVVRWFASPVLATPGATRRARVLWRMSWSLWSLLAAVLIASGLLAPAMLARRLVSLALVAALVICLHMVNRRGRTTFASWLLVLGLIAIVTQRAWQTGGVHAPVALFYMMIVFMAAGLLGIRGSLAVALACVASSTLLAGAELGGLLVVPETTTSTPTQGFVTTMAAIAIAVLWPMLLFRQAEERATEEIVNMFVHDMRSPLTILFARLSMLRADIPDRADVAEHIDAMMAEAMRLNLMANNLLEVSRLESTSLPLHRVPLNVSALAPDVARTLAPLDPSRHIEVRASVPVICTCDAGLLRRIIENLLSNAIKHAPEGGHVVVEVTHTGANVRIIVEDDGPGVPPKDRHRIFERYSAKSSRALSGHHSVGLGLAFCRLATAAHGGRIWVEEAHPHGSRFVVELPAG